MNTTALIVRKDLDVEDMIECKYVVLRNKGQMTPVGSRPTHPWLAHTSSKHLDFPEKHTVLFTS